MGRMGPRVNGVKEGDAAICYTTGVLSTDAAALGRYAYASDGMPDARVLEVDEDDMT